MPFIDCSNSAAFFTAEQIFLRAWEARAFLAFLLRLLIFLRIEYDYKNAEIFFGKQAEAFASRRGGARFRLRRVPFEGAKSTRPEKRRAPKASWGTMPQTPVAEGKKNLLSLKAANSRARGDALLWWCS